MLTESFPTLGAVLLGAAALASAAAGWLLSRVRLGSDQVTAGGAAAVLLLVTAVAAASGAAALSDGTWGLGGWLPFAAGLALACLPVTAAGLAGRRRGARRPR